MKRKEKKGEKDKSNGGRRSKSKTQDRSTEARRKGREEEQEHRRQGEQEQNTGQEHSKQGKQDWEEARAESADEPEATGRSVERRTGRGSAGLVRGVMRGVGRTSPAEKGWLMERTKSSLISEYGRTLISAYT